MNQFYWLQNNFDADLRKDYLAMYGEQPVALVICAIFRNEARYLREWIEFHRIVGVQRFYLYQNRSDDDWQVALEPYLAEGIVEVTDWPFGPPCQLQAYQHFIDKHKGKRWWAAFIDCDEFLFSPLHDVFTDALVKVASPASGAIAVNWMCFGAAGQEQSADEPVIERFTLRPADSFGPNRHIKSIVRMDRVRSTGRNPHYFPVSGGTFDELGGAVTGPLTPQPSHNLIRINHYHTKSREEYDRKLARGNADQIAPRRDEFDYYQALDIKDTAILRFLIGLCRRQDLSENNNLQGVRWMRQLGHTL